MAKDASERGPLRRCFPPAPIGRTMSNGLTSAVNLTCLSRHRVKNGGFNSKERNGRRARLSLDGSRERCNDNRSGFRLPEGIDDCTLLAADVFVVPIPSFRVDRFPNSPQYANAAEIVPLDMLCTESTKKADSCRSGVELCDFVLLNGFPVTRGCRVYRSGLEHGCGDTVGKRSINDISVTSDPTNISHATKLVI